MRATETKVTNKKAVDGKKCRRVVITVLFATTAMSMGALAGQWRQNDTGWWYQNENGTYLKSERFWTDGKCYYFNENGYCLQSAQTPDGCNIDAQGTWIEGDVVQTQEQSQDSNTIKRIDNAVVTAPGEFIFHPSGERRTYTINMDGNNFIYIMSESLANFGEYAKLIYTYQERILDTAVEAELRAPQSKTTSHLTSGSWYCYHYMDASSLGIPGLLEVYARISGGRVQVVMSGGIVPSLDTGRVVNSLAFL